MAATTVSPDTVNLAYVQQYLYLGSGLFSIVTSSFAVWLIGSSKQLRQSQPFFLALSVGDWFTSTAYVVMASMRIVMLNQNIYFDSVKSAQCLKMPFIYLFLFGTGYSTLMFLLMNVNILVKVAFPNWYKTNLTLGVSKMLIYSCLGYTLFSIVMGIIATLYYGADGSFMPKRSCSLITIFGNIFGPYHYILCVSVNSIAAILAIVTFILTKRKISELRVKGKSFAVVLAELKDKLRQSITALLITMIAYLMNITTNVGFLTQSLHLPSYSLNEIGGKVAVSLYVLSCGLTIFILFISEAEVRKELKKRFFRLTGVQRNSVATIA